MANTEGSEADVSPDMYDREFLRRLRLRFGDGVFGLLIGQDSHPHQTKFHVLRALGNDEHFTIELALASAASKASETTGQHEKAE